MQAEMVLMPEKALESWKEIAVFLRRGVRTVQRWERDESLPVVRRQHLKRGSVRAYAAELERWQRQREQRMLPRPVSHPDPIDRMRSLIFEQRVLVEELKRAHTQCCAGLGLPSREAPSSSQALALAVAVR